MFVNFIRKQKKHKNPTQLSLTKMIYANGSSGGECATPAGTVGPFRQDRRFSRTPVKPALFPRNCFIISLFSVKNSFPSELFSEQSHLWKWNRQNAEARPATTASVTVLKVKANCDAIPFPRTCRIPRLGSVRGLPRPRRAVGGPLKAGTQVALISAILWHLRFTRVFPRSFTCTGSRVDELRLPGIGGALPLAAHRLTDLRTVLNPSG